MDRDMKEWQLSSDDEEFWVSMGELGQMQHIIVPKSHRCAEEIARLLVAAPSLLTVCEKLAAMWTNPRKPVELCRELAEEARKAIAKIKG